MSENRPRRYFPKLLMLDDESIAFLRQEAAQRNPAKAGAREQSGVARDAIAFAAAHHALFVTWIAIRSRITE